jgi:hypothetical protein
MRNTRMHIRLFICLVALSLGPRTALAARDRDAASFPSSITVAGEPLALRGHALLRVGYVFKVYHAALYLGAEVAAERVFDDVPKRLEIAYLRPFTARQIREAGDAILARQVGPGELAALSARLARINALYRDIQPGDRYTLTYVPGEGSTLALNGQALGTVEGADFAAAYFGIWLHPGTTHPELRAALLGEDG